MNKQPSEPSIIVFDTDMKKLKQCIACGAALLAITLASTGCSTPKQITYFQDLNSETVIPVTPKRIKIEPDDRLSIVVKTQNPTLSALFNLNVVADRTGDATGATAEGLSAYTVSPKGTIDFPLLGEITVAGMERTELAGFIKGELMGRQLVTDPVVTVELLSNGISVLGEVNRPGRVAFERDQMNIIEALARAGDLSIQGRRDNVTVMRETPQGLQTYILDLTDMKTIAQSPAFYLEPDDVIYVEPNDIRKRQASVNGNNVLSWSFWVSVASLLTSVALLIVK